MLQVDKMDKVDKGKIYLRDTAVLKQKINVMSMNVPERNTSPPSRVAVILRPPQGKTSLCESLS